MQPKTEELLYFLHWSVHTLMRPTFRNLTDSYESWAYRNGLTAQLARLERRHLLEKHPQLQADRLYRLTEQGRLHALGGRDPEVQWARGWDGHWRLVLFDVPVDEDTRRQRLRRYLRHRAFGCLQGSVWITPDPVHAERDILADGRVNVTSLLLLEARPAAGENDQEIVAAAWDFSGINRRYAEHQEVLDRFPTMELKGAEAAQVLRRWAGEEREAWLAAVKTDPLLPERLLPPGYLGRPAWKRRKEVLVRAGERIRSYLP